MPYRRRTYSEGTRGVTSHRPPPPTVERRALFHEYSDDSASAEGFRIDLALDFEDVEREEDLGE